MNFLITDSFVKIEIICLSICLVYLCFVLIYETFSVFRIIKNIVKPNRIILDDEEIKAVIEEKLEQIEEEQLSDETPHVIDNNESEEPQVSEAKKVAKDELSKDEKDEVAEIIKSAKNKITRWEYSDAKAKIIEWLSIDKFNKQLNILLASIYEKDKDYKKAEFIYKDLIVLNEHDTEIYLKLGFILSIQSKYEVAYEIYKKLNYLDKTNMEAIEMLANIWHHLGNFEDSRIFTKMFLKKNPRNIDLLYLQALNLINLEERKEAIEMLKKVRQIEPYNVKVNELIDKIQLELEMEKNFNTKSVE